MAEIDQGPRRQLRRAGRRREHVHKVAVTAEQEAELVRRAAARSVTVPRLLVEAGLAGGADQAAARAELAGELFRIVRMLGQVGNNINQLAKVTNATGAIQSTTVHALAAQARVCERLQQFLDDMDRR